MSPPRPDALIPARLEYAADGTPISTRYDDVYHSTEGGPAQSTHVFIAGNQLHERWPGRANFSILETGFGLGLNFLVTWQAWRNDAQRSARLHFISSELHPFSRADLAVLHTRWPELATLAAELQAAWPPLTAGFHHLLLDDERVSLTLLFGDANQTLPQLLGTVDAIYLDGFAPQKNPQLWSPALLAHITRHAAVDATLTSWCVAGETRSVLKALGWHLKKRPGFAHKWQMLSGTLPANSAAPTPCKRAPAHNHALVIGAGIAGCSMAEALTRRGWQVTLLEQHAAPAQAASGNPVGLLHPMLAKDDNLAARFSRAAYLYSRRLLQQLDAPGSFWRGGGILQMAENAAAAAAMRKTCAHFPAEYVSWLERDDACQRSGLAVGAGGWWFPQGAWVRPQALCQRLLHAAGPRLISRFNSQVARLEWDKGAWRAYAADGSLLASAAQVILANAAAASALLPDTILTLRNIRGQLSYLAADTLPPIDVALCGAGYAIRPDHGPLVIGASFVENDADDQLREEEHQDNLQRLGQLLPNLNTAALRVSGGRVSFRAASHDRLPLVGQLPGQGVCATHSLDKLPRQQGLHALLGFGARGLSWAPFAAEVLAAQLNGEVLPLEQALIRALDPARHHLRWVRREDNTPTDL